jgi:subtilisin family serine protease
MKASCLVAAIFSVLTSANVFAAFVDQNEYDSLVAQALQRGAVRVMVTLRPVSLTEIRSDLRAVQAEMAGRATVLLAELDAAAWKAGYWSNGIGQIGVYTTPSGLQKLAATKNAVAFGVDPTGKMRWRHIDLDGRIAALEAATANGGVAHLELALNADAFDFDIPAGGAGLQVRDGSVLSSQADRAMFQLSLLLQGVAPRTSATLRKHPARPASALVEADAQGLAVLLETDLVRGIAPADFVDTRRTVVDSDLLTRAREAGGTEVVIEMRLHNAVALSQAFVAPQAWHAQTRALHAALSEIIGGLPGALLVQEIAGLGSAVVRVGEPAARQLIASPDPRILRIALNSAQYSGALTDSIPTTHMNHAHDAGYTAPGQHIVIIDSGIRKSHAFFGGSAKVFFEGCWGTTSSAFNPPLVSRCPNQDLNGDSAFGQLGSGEPISCVGLPDAYCSYHGTHVAGIAAGRLNGIAGYSGVASSAQLVAFNVASWPTDGSAWRSAEVDMIAALQAVRDAAPDSTYVVNMSIVVNGFKTTLDCPSMDQTMTAVIQDLFNRGIPVVVSAGNDGQVAPRFGVSFPACVPNVIKVAGTINDGARVGTTVAAASDIVPDASMTGPILLAPGFNITSATQLNDTDLRWVGGTSMAAPHIAGYYSVLKAALPTFGVADLTGWIMASGSIDVSMLVNGITYHFRRMQAPL